MTTAGMTYPERRSAAIALAAAYSGWGRPPTPEGVAPTWRIVWLPRTYGRKPCSARVPNTPTLDAEQAAKERRQNREKFA